MVAYLFFKAALPAILGLVAAIVFYFGGAYDLPPAARLATIGGGLLLGFVLPDVVVKNAISKRRDKTRKSLPDALDLMVICAEAGLSLDAMLKRVADEFAQGGPELADELVLTSIEFGFLPDRKQALVNLNLRTDQPGIRALCNALNQCEKFGTPLALSMRVLSAEFREERMLKAEEKAARLPALLTVPMIVFILPPLFIVLLGPAILRLVDAFSAM
jgi:tight adherence protein C